MRICVVGAGAIGGLLAVKLAELGETVTAIIRGPHLQAVRANGMKLVIDGMEHVAQLAATDRIAEVGAPQDLVILALKAHQLGGVAAELKSLCGPDTVMVTAQNGIPWWYFFKYKGPHRGTVLQSVDPGGTVAANVDVDRVIGSIIYPGSGHRLPGGHSPHRRGPNFPGRARRRRHRATSHPDTALPPGRVQGTGFKRPSLGNLGQTLGKLHLQPHQRAHARDACGPLSISTDAGACGKRHA